MTRVLLPTGESASLTTSQPSLPTWQQGWPHGDPSVAVLAVVRVEDNQGRLDQRREQARVAWAPLATEPDKVLPVLEGFARQAAIERRSVRLAELARFLDSSGIVRIFPGWRIDIDPDAYVAALDQELERIDVAKLPPLDQIVMDGHAQEMDLQALPRLAVVSGGHGTGKSRLSIELAKTWIRAGRPGLHTRLAAWATGLVDMLLGELSVSVGRRVSQSELIGYLGSPASFLVLDSFDEIPLAQRDEALRQIDQLARQQPTAPDRRDHAPNYAKPEWSVGTAAVEAAHPRANQQRHRQCLLGSSPRASRHSRPAP